MSGSLNEGEILFELIRIGNSVKVTAVDPASGVEASIVGAATTHPDVLQNNALRKLRFVLAKRANPGR